MIASIMLMMGIQQLNAAAARLRGTSTGCCSLARIGVVTALGPRTSPSVTPNSMVGIVWKCRPLGYIAAGDIVHHGGACMTADSTNY